MTSPFRRSDSGAARRRVVAHVEEATTFLQPITVVRAQAHAVLGRLARTGPEGVVAAQIEEALKRDVGSSEPSTVTNAAAREPISRTYFRHLVIEGQKLLNEREIAGIQKAQRSSQRGLFLLGVLLLAIVGLTLLTGEVFVLLMGAVGGALSRVRPSKTEKAKPVETSTVMLLAPPAGAIAAFAGLLLIALLVQVKVLNAETFGRFETFPCIEYRSDPDRADETGGTDPTGEEAGDTSGTDGEGGDPGDGESAEGDSSEDCSVDASVLAVAFVLGFAEPFLPKLVKRATGAFDSDEDPPPTESAVSVSVVEEPDDDDSDSRLAAVDTGAGGTETNTPK